MKTLKKLNLQLFAEGETPNVESTPAQPEVKTFTQEEVDKMIQDRLARENKKTKEENDKVIKELQEKVAGMEREKTFKDLSEEQRAIKEKELELEKQNKTIAELQNKINEFQRQARVGEVVSAYTTDSQVGVKEFGSIAHLIANIDDEDSRLEAYKAVLDFAQAIEKEVRGDVLKQTSPNGANTTIKFENNPFKTGNLTQIGLAIRNDKESARDMAREAGVYDKYQNLLK